MSLKGRVRITDGYVLVAYLLLGLAAYIRLQSPLLPLAQPDSAGYIYPALSSLAERAIPMLGAGISCIPCGASYG